MVNAATRKPRWMEAALAATLLVSFFQPWFYSMGTPIAAHEIRERLAGPHRLLSAFTSGTRLSLDYRLSLFLWAVPVCAGLVLALILIRRYRPWAGFVAGAVGVVAFFFLRGEVAAFPFHRMAGGAYLALTAGAGLALTPITGLLRR
jgi:hypothetical protein